MSLKLVPNKQTKKRGLSRKPKIKRFCRICKKLLPASRYFKHEECQIEVDYYDIYVDYGCYTKVA